MYEKKYTEKLRKNPPPQAACVQHFFLDDDEPPAVKGSLRDRMPSLSGPQERTQWRTVQQIVDPVPLLPTLDDPAPQMVEQLPDILHFLRALSPDPEQAIEVPKILPVDVPLRTSVREPQLVEQLVEVPTIVSFSSLQRIAEQNVDIPVVGGSGTGGGLSGFLPGQNYSMTAEQIVDNAVPRRSFSGDLQGFPPGQSSSKRTANKIADIPVPSGGLQDFPETLQRAGVSSDLPDEANQGFFSTFLRV